MGERYTFEIHGFCIVNEDDWGKPVTVQQIQQDISDLLKYDLCIDGEILVTNLET